MWRALPALSQCLDDSLRRFGTVTLTGLQVTRQYLSPLAPDSVIDYVSPRNGFNLAGPAGAQAHIAFDHAWLGDRIAELPDRFPNPGAFEFGPVVTGPAPHRIQVPAETPFLRGLAAARLGLAVTLPEWSARAAGWTLALALYTARTLLLPEAPLRGTVRVTRVPCVRAPPLCLPKGTPVRPAYKGLQRRARRFLRRIRASAGQNWPGIAL